MISDQILNWLLDGDVSIQYQTFRDLLNKEKPRLRKKIESEGWGKAFLSRRNANGHWGRGFYQPKWTSTHYTLLDLKNLCMHPSQKEIRETLKLIFTREKGPDGGINPSGTIRQSDVCINGMVLNYASYFNVREDQLKSVVDFLLSQKMNDGGFNCHLNRKGATHSSLHTTLSVLEGIHEYGQNDYSYRLNELKRAESESREFLMRHKLFRSERTGRVINPKFLSLHYPGRWYFDILKALDYCQQSGCPLDARMYDALKIIAEKQTADGFWKLACKHPGQSHFEMERAGFPSRWITLRALRVLKMYS